jgi:hypothetical protein
MSAWWDTERELPVAPEPRTCLPDAVRFWARVDRSGECWLWLGSHHEFGYGWFWANGRSWNAHRVAWELTNGVIPSGRVVMHTCDNPPCVNPAHLRLGTVADNQSDMAAKGRSTKGRPRPPRTVLTDAQVRELRALSRSGMAASNLAARYGMDATSVHAILRGARRANA